MKAAKMKFPNIDMLMGAVFLLAVEIGGYGLWLLVVGVRQISESGSWFEPHPAGWIPLLGAVLVITGLLRQQLWLAWVGAFVIAAFSALFLFSIGGGLTIPLSVLLLVLLSLITGAKHL